MKDIHRKIATVLGLGDLPFAPGTYGSAAGLLVCLLLRGNVSLNVIAFLVFFTIGVVSSKKTEEAEGTKDPSFIVIDEFACIFIAYLFLPLTPLYIITGFILYRVIDIFKVPPMKKLESIGGGWGIMLDDLMAAIYVNLILHLIHYFI